MLHDVKSSYSLYLSKACVGGVAGAGDRKSSEGIRPLKFSHCKGVV